MKLFGPPARKLSWLGHRRASPPPKVRPNAFKKVPGGQPKFHTDSEDEVKATWDITYTLDDPWDPVHPDHIACTQKLWDFFIQILHTVTPNDRQRKPPVTGISLATVVVERTNSTNATGPNAKLASTSISSKAAKQKGTKAQPTQGPESRKQVAALLADEAENEEEVDTSSSKRCKNTPLPSSNDKEEENGEDDMKESEHQKDFSEEGDREEEGSEREGDEGGDNDQQPVKQDLFEGEESTVSSQHPISSFIKTKLGDIESPHTKYIAKLGHQQLRLHMAIKHAFSMANNHEKLCWEMLVNAMEKHPVLWVKMKDNIQKNQDEKNCLIDYVWKVATQVQGEAVSKARLVIPSLYGLPGEFTR
ncbi:hypothetical protein HYDPIDRAFT_165063 [Hydnomerulius pinastri MD-312]|nr:hypothetical protein HYDPIDRAFT_165063 [Hydnomerulius pinastri MD-312]